MKIYFILLTLLICSFISSATTYKYDNSNKLQQVTYDNGTVVSYEYDTDGNIIKISPTDSSSGGGDTGGGTDNGGGDTGGTDNGTPETPKKESGGGGSFGFGLFALVALSSLFRRVKSKKSR